MHAASLVVGLLSLSLHALAPPSPFRQALGELGAKLAVSASGPLRLVEPAAPCDAVHGAPELCWEGAAYCRPAEPTFPGTPPKSPPGEDNCSHVECAQVTPGPRPRAACGPGVGGGASTPMILRSTSLPPNFLRTASDM